ncbi:Rid family hydrolase, partial [Amylibacter sp.]|nr:Rid family hydrolase [Amylibacter sp.]
FWFGRYFGWCRIAWLGMGIVGWNANAATFAASRVSIDRSLEVGRGVARTYSFPQDHWNWPVDLTHQQGVRAGEMIFTGGQVDLTPEGAVRNPGDLKAQCAGAMTYMRVLLEDLGSSTSDLVRLVVYFVGGATEEKAVLAQIAEFIGPNVMPVVNTISLDELCYPDMMIEIEGVAMRGTSGEAIERQRLRDPRLPMLADGYSHVVRCSDMIFVSDMSALGADGRVQNADDIAAQSKIMMENLSAALSLVGADMDDLVKLNTFYLGGGTAEDWAVAAKVRIAYLNEPGPAATGIPVTRFAQDGLCTKIAATAMLNADGSRIEKTYSWPDGHWDWPTHLPFKHGNKCGAMIHVGGQVSMDAGANVLDTEDMVSQTRTAMANIKRVLAEFGADLDDVVKVTTFYQGNASARALHENLLIRSASYAAPGPATTGIPMEALAYQAMVIEIEVIAMLDR